MFVDLDWPLNASSLLSASAELLVFAVTPIRFSIFHFLIAFTVHHTFFISFQAQNLLFLLTNPFHRDLLAPTGLTPPRTLKVADSWRPTVYVSVSFHLYFDFLVVWSYQTCRLDYTTIDYEICSLRSVISSTEVVHAMKFLVVYSEFVFVLNAIKTRRLYSVYEQPFRWLSMHLRGAVLRTLPQFAACGSTRLLLQSHQFHTSRIPMLQLYALRTKLLPFRLK